ncbi:MAG: hypothetical protein IT385_08320 [Deltaproteobacteria bacterium]|nr:hypothetical protein [Deltaproteobacteria bacterium]
MRPTRVALVVLSSLVAAVGLTACASAPADWGLVSGLVAALTTLALALPMRGARAGAPMPCQGYEATSCEDGFLRKHCCPEGTKCNFDFPRYLDCGQGTCVVGADIGRCPAPVPRVTPAAATPGCGEGWELACVDRRVTKACIPPVPTNYTGPGMNPPFRACGDGRAKRTATPADFTKADVGARCTTHVLYEDCFPSRGEVLPRSCLGAWEKVCLGGKVVHKCLPEGAPADAFPAKAFVACDDGSCAVGADKAACP